MTSVGYAIPSLARPGIKVVVIEFIKHPGRVTHESIFKMTKEWQRPIKSGKC